MTRKHDRAATALSAILEGRAPRRQFDAWHQQRRRTGKGFVLTMRLPASPKRAARKHQAR